MSTRQVSALRTLVLAIVIMVAVATMALRSQWNQRGDAVPYENAARSLPVIETLAREHVTFLRVQDWCRAYADGRERRATELTATCTLDMSGDYRLFDDASEKRFLELQDNLKGLPYSVHWIDLEYDSAGVLRTAELAIDTVNPFRRDTLVYAPGYATPEDIPGEVVSHRIDSDWFYRWEDWN